MRNLIKNNDKCMGSKKTDDVSQIVINGHTMDVRDSDELDLYRFMIGGLQAK